MPSWQNRRHFMTQPARKPSDLRMSSFRALSEGAFHKSIARIAAVFQRLSMIMQRLNAVAVRGKYNPLMMIFICFGKTL